MVANPIWIAGYGGTPSGGASPVWIVGYGGAIAGAAESWIAGYGGTPAAGASPVWVMGYGGTPTGGASPIWIGGYITGSGSGGGGATSVWSAADATANGMTLTNGGRTVTGSAAGVFQTVRSTIGKTSGKLYAEFSSDASVANNSSVFGAASAGFDVSSYLGTSNYSGGIQLGTANYVSSGFTSNFITHFGGASPNTVYGVAVDFSAGKIWMSVSNAWIDSLGEHKDNDPASGVLPVLSFVPATVGALFIGVSLNGVAAGKWTLQSTAASLTYAPPTGFKAWDAP